VTVHTAEGRRLRADAERNRERILAAAADVFASAGLEATLHDVAERAGVGVGTVYRRFPDKEALIEALFDDKLHGLVEIVQQADADADSWAALVGFLRSVAVVQSENRGLNEVLNGSTYCQDRVGAARAELSPLIQQLLERAKADGVVRPDVEPSDLTVILLMLNTVALYTHGARTDLWERYLELLLEGLRVHPDQMPLLTPPLTEDELFDSMSAWHRLRR
jgi:AcrR family transcriptional regulator